MYLELKRYCAKALGRVPFTKSLESKYCCICDNKVNGFSPYREGWKTAPFVNGFA